MGRLVCVCVCNQVCVCVSWGHWEPLRCLSNRGAAETFGLGVSGRYLSRLSSCVPCTRIHTAHRRLVALLPGQGETGVPPRVMGEADVNTTGEGPGLGGPDPQGSPPLLGEGQGKTAGARAQRGGKVGGFPK